MGDPPRSSLKNKSANAGAVSAAPSKWPASAFATSSGTRPFTTALPGSASQACPSFRFTVISSAPSVVEMAWSNRSSASPSKMFVVRDKDLSQKPAKVELSSEVGPGDTITIEESFF